MQAIDVILNPRVALKLLDSSIQNFTHMLW